MDLLNMPGKYLMSNTKPIRSLLLNDIPWQSDKFKLELRSIPQCGKDHTNYYI